MITRGVVLEDFILDKESRDVHVFEELSDSSVCYLMGNCDCGDGAKIVANRQLMLISVTTPIALLASRNTITCNIVFPKFSPK
jgi:hypothetical protein